MKFSENQQVIINPESEYKHQGIKNDIPMIGNIFRINYEEEYDDEGKHYYKVEWEDGTSNDYRNKDLLPYSTEPNYEIY